MDPQKITELAKLLKNEGDKVLNNEYKLTLSGSLLRALNDSFTLITAEENAFGFKVIKPTDAKSDVFRDLQFIHDFVQRTVILCITGRFQDDERFEGQIDVSKFINIKTLEMQKVAVTQVIGLKQLRAHLEQLLAVHGSIKTIREIIYECGGDYLATDFIWNKLLTVDFSFNALKCIDTSFEYSPYLETVNLSHNQLCDVSALCCLQNLKFVNLSFNRLTKIPTFHSDAYRKLQTLLIASNFIEDISDISWLDSLIVCDLSCNCLIDHSILLPISPLMALQDLNLFENPLACHPKHRQATVRYLHRNTASVKFLLDGEPLTNHEKSLTGVYENYRPVLKSRPSEIALRVARALESNYSETPIGSIQSTSSFGLETRFDENKGSDFLSASIISQQKRVKAREAKISDELPTSLEKSGHKSLEGSTDHLETKKQIETLREQYGSQWLHNQSGDMVKNVVGFESKRDSAKEYIENLLKAEMSSSQLSPETETEEMFRNVDSSTPVDKFLLPDEASGTEYQSMVETEDVESDYKSLSDNTLKEMNFDPGYNPNDQDAPVSDSEDGEEIYICKDQDSNEVVFLVVSERYIRERHVLTTRTLTKWGIKALESCERSKSDVISLQFDMINKNKKARRYQLEQNACEKLDQQLRKVLEQRPLFEMNQKLYRCAVCTTQFSREEKSNKNKETSPTCPDCKSSYVLEITEAPQKYSPDKVNLGNAKVKQESLTETTDKIQKTSSHSSIAALSTNVAWNSSAHKNKLSSAASNQDSSSCSKISKSDSSFDSNQSVAGSAPSERDTDFHGNESDIEVLSNPSQSSIEVLDRDSLQSSRKHSEERRNFHLLELDALENVHLDSTIYNVNVGLLKETKGTSTIDGLKNTKNNKDGGVKTEATTQTTGPLKNMPLTESSSSGSVTDSICTAYEQNQEEQASNSKSLEKTSDSSSLKSLSVKTESTSVIDSVLNLLKSKTKTTSDSSDQEPPIEPYKYSFTDFNLTDHRLKLFLLRDIFEDSNESLKWIVKGRIYDENTTETVLPGFNGFFVMSTTKFYVLKTMKKECDDPSNWLKRFISGTVDRIITLRVLPFKVGITFTIKGIGNIHLLLHDILRTDSLLLYLSDNDTLPDTCLIEYRISEDLMHKLTALAEQQKIRIVSFLNSCVIEKEQQRNQINFCAFIITDNCLYLSSSNFKWLSASETSIGLESSQQMCNLLEVLDVDPCTMQLSFIDETQPTPVEESWQLNFDTDTSCASAFETISQCWEKIFSVPLTKISSNNNSTKNQDE